MIKKALCTILLLGSVLFAAPPAPYIVDSSHSQINFVADARLISAHGSFDKWTADVSFDPEKIETSSFKITIDAASINTRVERRDNHLRSKDFFDVAQYPSITFTSKKITKAGDRRYDVVGDMNLHGVTKEMTVPLEMVFYEGNRGRFRGTFQVNRRDFGITFDSKMNPIQDMVAVHVDINVLNKEAVEKARKEAAEKAEKEKAEKEKAKPNSN